MKFLLEYPVVKTIWERVGLWVRAPCLQPANWEDADNVKEWFLQMMNRLPSPMKEGLRSLIVLTSGKCGVKETAEFSGKNAGNCRRLWNPFMMKPICGHMQETKVCNLYCQGRATSSLM